MLGTGALIAAALALPGTVAVDAVPDPASFPQLQAVGQLTAPGHIDAGLGVYPILSPPGELAFPSPAALESARRYAATRAGRVSFAIDDPRSGIAGFNLDRRYRSASLSKAMVLVGRLRVLAAEGRRPSAAERKEMEAMITMSDNVAATRVYGRARPESVDEIGRLAGMRSLVTGPMWSETWVTAADQVRFFLSLDELVPPEERTYARGLLEGIVPEQSWGTPEAARPRGWRVYFKGGWRPAGPGVILHQGALLERGSQRLSLAVLSDGVPDEEYGHETVRGITERLLGSQS